MILRAAWVAPVSSAPIRDGFVRIAAARIVEVGACSSRVFGEECIDLGAVILTPGLVNPHTHLELGCYAGMIEPMPLWPWLERLIELRRRPGQLERETDAVTDGAWQSLRSGVTCVGDISRRNLAWKALKTVPIRKVSFVELLTLADHPPRNPDELRRAVREVEEDALLTAGVTPHAPYTVPADQIRAAIALADQIERPWTMHLAESREEIRWLRGERGVLPPALERLIEQCAIEEPHTGPVDLVRRCGRDLRRGSLAHVNYVSAEEIEALARERHVVIYCPRAHRYYQHAPHPYRAMRAAGLPVALGTDSPASNESVSLLDEMHFVYATLADAPAPGELLRMGTLTAARALNLDALLGTIETGKQADLAAFPIPVAATDPIAALLDEPTEPIGVWVAGRRVV